MPEFLDLPDELLLAIVNGVRKHTNTLQQGYRNLQGIALSCRKLRPIAQEVLHIEATIQRARSLRGLNNLTYLVRTLIQRPDLALKVRTLDLGIIGNPIMHSGDCSHLVHPEEQNCTCPFKGFISLCIDHLRTAITMDGLSLYNQNWAINIRNGLQIAGMYGHLRKTIKSLTALKYLSLQFGSCWGNRFNTELGELSEASYKYVASKLESLSLTHLALDVEDIKRTWFDEFFDVVPVEEIYPMTSFVRLPNLRYITAPQEAFFSLYDSEKYNLPESIESIGIIDPTTETMEYLSHLSSHQEQWPNLRLIIFEKGTYGHGYYRKNANSGIYHDSDKDHYQLRCLELWRKSSELTSKGVRISDVKVELVRDRFAWRDEWTG